MALHTTDIDLKLKIIPVFIRYRTITTVKKQSTNYKHGASIVNTAL